MEMIAEHVTFLEYFLLGHYKITVFIQEGNVIK